MSEEGWDGKNVTTEDGQIIYAANVEKLIKNEGLTLSQIKKLEVENLSPSTEEIRKYVLPELQKIFKW